MSDETCLCGHHSHDHGSDPSGTAGSPCWHADTYDGYGYPALNPCPCRDYNPVPHSSWNSAETRANAHHSTISALANVCPVEQGRDYCPICCAVTTD